MGDAEPGRGAFCVMQARSLLGVGNLPFGSSWLALVIPCANLGEPGDATYAPSGAMHMRPFANAGKQAESAQARTSPVLPASTAQLAAVLIGMSRRDTASSVR